jgi:signal transduction histidine kinase
VAPWRGALGLVGDPRFWVVQLLTVLINVAIALLWGRLAGLPTGEAEAMFGLAGAVATVAVVAVFRGAFLVVWHDPLQLWVLGAVYASILAVAVLVGDRVEREAAARREAEAARNEARAYAASVLRAHEEERSRIAQELHDEPLQRVVLLCHQLDGALADGGGRAHLDAARRTAEAVADELRRLARGLRPPILDELGLAAAVRMAARDLRERVPDLEVEVSVRGPERRLDPLVELNLFRIAQEALRNVERHAGARAVDVVLAYREDGVRLSVGDDGRGLASGDGARPAGARLGLAGMRERARQLGGRLEVDSAPAAGTRIGISVQAV